jgi:uroporphyrinogen decarboxylase
MTDRLIVRALRREPTERTPVWLMRQAGRYLPEYREVREQAGGFLEMVRRPELAAEVTLQPIRRFGMDGAILFSDILVPLEAMGMELVFDHRGPVLPEPVRTRAAVDSLAVVDPAATMPYVGEALRLTRAGLPDETALLGFCGAPFTLATYAIEGGTSKAFLEVRRMMWREPELFDALLAKLAEVVGQHMLYQIECGAEAVMLFDTWAGMLTREDYERVALPHARRALEMVAGRAPRIGFVHGGDHLLESMLDLGSEALGIDPRTSMSAAFERTGDRVALQGNLDPGVLLSTPAVVGERTRALLDEVGGRPGHVLNLGHGVLKITDPACVGAFVEAARAGRRRDS